MAPISHATVQGQQPQEHHPVAYVDSCVRIISKLTSSSAHPLVRPPHPSFRSARTTVTIPVSTRQPPPPARSLLSLAITSNRSDLRPHPSPNALAENPPALVENLPQVDTPGHVPGEFPEDIAAENGPAIEADEVVVLPVLGTSTLLQSLFGIHI
ncbi:hypothetical protein FRC11_007355 [Ceratobasidium sp. 423]|nr:hypothetical protein FRC11_007355 [Ceratobasidium sp. 423]